MLDVKVKCRQTASPKEIQDFVADIDTEVLVGFLAGRQHVPTLHKADTEKPNEKRRGDNGKPAPTHNKREYNSLLAQRREDCA